MVQQTDLVNSLRHLSWWAIMFRWLDYAVLSFIWWILWLMYCSVSARWILVVWKLLWHANRSCLRSSYWLSRCKGLFQLLVIQLFTSVLGMTLNCIHIFIVTGSFLYWCVMRLASQHFFIHRCICLRILIISCLATFLGTNSLSVLMCRKAVNQSTFYQIFSWIILNKIMHSADLSQVQFELFLNVCSIKSILLLVL